MNFQIIKNLSILDLKKELNFLLSNGHIEWGNNGKQICLNHIYEDSDDIHFGIGSLGKDWNNKKLQNSTISVPRKTEAYLEKDFVHICNQFKGTLFEEIYDEVRSVYKVGRTRLMRTMPFTCMSWHYDTTKRLHFPIKSQEGCFMLIENEVAHLKENTWYMTDTLKYHTAFNSSYEDRIHLVFCILD